MLAKDSPIRLRPATFNRVPFTRLRHLRGKTGTVRRAVHNHRGRVLWECEIEGVTVLCWEEELVGVIQDKRNRLPFGNTEKIT